MHEMKVSDAAGYKKGFPSVCVTLQESIYLMFVCLGDICQNQLHSIFYTVIMCALHTMGCVNTGTD